MTAAIAVAVALALAAGLVVVLIRSIDTVGARAETPAETAAGATDQGAASCPQLLSVPVAVGNEDAALVTALGEAWRSSSPALACVELDLITGAADAAPGVRPVAVFSRSPDFAAAPVVGVQGDPVPVARTVVVYALPPDLARSVGWPGQVVTPQDVLALSTSAAATEAGGVV